LLPIAPLTKATMMDRSPRMCSPLSAHAARHRWRS
jgi:hypothetical protein